jgi:hypothetical protein
MFRKFAVALLAIVIAVGTGFAEEVKAVFVKFADGKLTVKVDDKEKEYKVPADLKRPGKDGKETLASESLGRMKEGMKLTLDVEKDTLKGYKVERKKKDN